MVEYEVFLCMMGLNKELAQVDDFSNFDSH
jgi:hypothetical protein